MFLGNQEISRPAASIPIFDHRFFDPMRAHIPITSSDVVSSNLSVVARCVALRSRILASVLLFLFRRDANGTRERADDNPLYGVLHDIANANQSTFEFRELMVRCLDLSGYFYARVERNARGGVTALRPFFPEDVRSNCLPVGACVIAFITAVPRELLLQEGVLHTVADGAFAKPRVALTVVAALTPFGAFVNERALRRREAALAAGN
jgi:hypothetical protein